MDSNHPYWVAFVERHVTFDDGETESDLWSFDNDYPTRDAALAVANAYAAELIAQAGDVSPPFSIEFLGDAAPP